MRKYLTHFFNSLCAFQRHLRYTLYTGWVNKKIQFNAIKKIVIKSVVLTGEWVGTGHFLFPTLPTLTIKFVAIEMCYFYIYYYLYWRTIRSLKVTELNESRC